MVCHTYALKIIPQAINHDKTPVTTGPATNLFLIVTWFVVLAHSAIQPRTVPLPLGTIISDFFSCLYILPESLMQITS